MTPLLETRDLSVSFGGLLALDNVSLSVARGSFVGLIGPNGAGKTTFVDSITGFVPSNGFVGFDDQDLSRARPHRRARAGLVRTFQSLELFDDLTVRENLLVGYERERWWSALADAVRPDVRTNREEIEWALDLLDLNDDADRLPSELPHGRRKLVGVGRALASRPRLVLLDEPAAGLDTQESRELGQRLRLLPEHGISVLLVDHDMSLVLRVCDSIYVLDFGRVIAQGTPGEIQRDPAVVAAYLGEQRESVVPSGDGEVPSTDGAST